MSPEPSNDRENVAVSGYGASFDRPVLSGIGFSSFALFAAVAVAIFRFRMGILPTLVGACLAEMSLFILWVL